MITHTSDLSIIRLQKLSLKYITDGLTTCGPRITRSQKPVIAPQGKSRDFSAFERWMEAHPRQKRNKRVEGGAKGCGTKAQDAPKERTSDEFAG